MVGYEPDKGESKKTIPAWLQATHNFFPTQKGDTISSKTFYKPFGVIRRVP